MPDNTFHSSGRQQSSHYHSQPFNPHPAADAWSPKPKHYKSNGYPDRSKWSPPNKHFVAGLQSSTPPKNYQHEQTGSSPQPSESDERISRSSDNSTVGRDSPSARQQKSTPPSSCTGSHQPLEHTVLNTPLGGSDAAAESNVRDRSREDDVSEDAESLTDDASSQNSDEPDEEEEEEHHASLSRSQSYQDDGSLSSDALQAELESRWILNLSMAFRDKSNREKFFITFAETPTRWRRVTVSVDYASASDDSLEASLSTLKWPRDKSAQIYEAIRNSLPTIQFYETVTNLKLETQAGRLHVHVTEDMNEIIKYPPMSVIGHLRFDAAEFVRESEVEFDAHLSGFVYKVGVGGQSMIKKEIPGPDMVDEFLYEVNALHKLRSAPDVIDLKGIVVDDDCCKIKGLLIAYAPGGSLVDLISDARDYADASLTWAQRQKWARQIVTGLCAVHEAGLVQGDFTLTNIVIDEHDDAKIIDINRRGCPMGWEPPEFLGLIESGQRLFMYIGVKSDMYQLGMVLWALACTNDEPERQERPLEVNVDKTGAPNFLKEWVDLCVKDDPHERWSAKDLLEKPSDLSPPIGEQAAHDLSSGNHAAIEIVGMDRQPDIEYPSDIPDTEFADVSKPSVGNAWSRPHAHSITGRDYYEDEPDEMPTFEHQDDYSAQANGSERRSVANTNRRIPSLLNGRLPLHQDSGLGAEEQELVHRMRDQNLCSNDDCPPPSAVRTHFGHPAHQDSGFGEGMLDLGPVPQDHAANNGRGAAGRKSRRNPDLLAGIGAHASARS